MSVNFSFCNATWDNFGFDRFKRRLLRRVSNFNNDPIKIFCNLNHRPITDQEFLHHVDCAKITIRLKEIIKDWCDNDYDKIHALKLISGMNFAVKNLKNFHIL